MSIDETFDIGIDTRTPVDDSYKLPFRFTGKIAKLTYQARARPDHGGGAEDDAGSARESARLALGSIEESSWPSPRSRKLGTGLALMIDPALVVRVAGWAAMSTGVGMLLGRCFGIALLALGLACWPSSEARRGSSAVGGC